MSEVVSGGDSRDVELRVAVERLLRLRRDIAQYPADLLRRVQRAQPFYMSLAPEDISSSELREIVEDRALEIVGAAVRECLDAPCWHRIEELLR